MSISDFISARNKAIIDGEIRKKVNLNEVYYPSKDILPNIITDVDHFPYTRFFRGVYDSPYPHVWEREAGFRKRRDACYKPQPCPVQTDYPNNVFQTGSSTELPTYPSYIRKTTDADRLFMESMLNRACIPGLYSR